MKRASRLSRCQGMARLIVCLAILVAIAGMAGCEAAAEAPTIESFIADPESISPGGSSALSWSVSGATEVTIDQGIGSVAATGTRSVSPATTTTYTLTASNSAGTRTATVQVTVSGLPVINAFAATPEVIVFGGNSTLSWDVSGATEVTIDQGIGAVAPTGTRTVTPTRSATYTIKATNSAGSKTAQVTVQMPVVYDFVAQASHNRTTWVSGWPTGTAVLTFPGAGNDTRGFARYVTNATLENNATYARVLQTHPYWVDNGYIRGGYFGLWDLGYKVEAGDRFNAKVGFLKTASAGNVKFVLLIVREGGSQTSIIEVADTYDGTLKTIDVDLSSYAGQRATFILEVNANGPSSQDWAVWVEAKIIHPYVL